LQPKVPALKHVSKPRASGWWSREMLLLGIASRFADGNTEDDGATAVP
jgi:hypothetical protein